VEGEGRRTDRGVDAYLLLGFISSTFWSKSRAERMLVFAAIEELCEEEEDESVESLKCQNLPKKVSS
jgi:hypothetical protein